ncbi:MAG: phosphopyruvate hydratase [Verrucomicrobiota bacterium]
MSVIADVSALQIYDSRGNPTVEAHVRLENGVVGRGLVPSGASTGQFEALELRDGDVAKFRGKSVLEAVANVEGEIAKSLCGRDVLDQEAIDRALIELDGTEDKSRLGANAILSASMAVASAAAGARGLPLFRSLGDGTRLPLPEIQLIGGGAHANWRIDIQDFMIVAVGAKSYEETLEMTFNVYHAAGDILAERGLRFGLADEGGFWPEFNGNEAAFEICLQAIERAGYTPGADVALSLDIASSDLWDPEQNRYLLRSEDKFYEADEFSQLMVEWTERYPIVSIEDPLADDQPDAWRQLNAEIGARVQLIGDDLFTTNPKRIAMGIEQQLANAVLIKLNQIGTVTETLEAIRMTQAAGWNPVVSARSGETEDAFIAHLAVATNAGQLKVGSFARSERMAKWNEVLRIAKELGDEATFDPKI